jgi:hypothetical protein
VGVHAANPDLKRRVHDEAVLCSVHGTTHRSRGRVQEIPNRLDGRRSPGNSSRLAKYSAGREERVYVEEKH